MPTTIEQKAIRLAKQYLTNRSYTVEIVTRDLDHPGYHLIAKRGKELLTIAVRGSRRRWDIPDLDATFFEKEKCLVADFLYVVYFIGKRNPYLCPIPRDVLKPESILTRAGYRISATFTNERILRPFIHRI